MSKREQTKAEVILIEARSRVAGALAAVSVAETALEVAKATLHAHRETFDALEKSLVSRPRKKSVAAAPAQTQLPTEEAKKAATQK